MVSEPGGIVDGLGMQIAGTPGYAPGEQVMLFLERMPNGYLRNAGMGQESSPSRPTAGYIPPHAGPISPVGQFRPTERHCRASRCRGRKRSPAPRGDTGFRRKCAIAMTLRLLALLCRRSRLELRSPRPHGRQSSPRRRIEYPVPGQPEDQCVGLANADGRIWITGDSDPVNAIGAALATWSGVPTSAVRFLAQRSTAAVNNASDRQHVMVFSDTPDMRICRW